MQRSLTVRLLSSSPLDTLSISYHRRSLLFKASPRLCLSTRAAAPSSALQRTVHAFRTPSSAIREQSVWHFGSSRHSQATHRDRTHSDDRGGYGGRGGSRGPWQLFIDRLNSIPSSYVFWGIVGVNSVVFAWWKVAQALYETNGDPSELRWLILHFQSSSEALRNGRWHTLITSCFSHSGFLHIFMNGFTYWFLAPPVMSMLGNARFLGLYLGSGIVANLTSVAWHDKDRVRVHGASGAILSLLSFYTCCMPTATFALYGIIELPAWALVAGMFAYDGYTALSQKRGSGRSGDVDGASHIGGMLAGITYFLAKQFRIF
ncbi:hypothetical protein BD413DRAFT_475177 [Trametes elegans]|nr:hypothetical protein BD413DRAFT_475177 [Trametes elegans]